MHRHIAYSQSKSFPFSTGRRWQLFVCPPCYRTVGIFEARRTTFLRILVHEGHRHQTDISQIIIALHIITLPVSVLVWLLVRPHQQTCLRRYSINWLSGCRWRMIVVQLYTKMLNVVSLKRLLILASGDMKDCPPHPSVPVRLVAHLWGIARCWGICLSKMRCFSVVLRVLGKAT